MEINTGTSPSRANRLSSRRMVSDTYSLYSCQDSEVSCDGASCESEGANSTSDTGDKGIHVSNNPGLAQVMRTYVSRFIQPQRRKSAVSISSLDGWTQSSDISDSSMYGSDLGIASFDTPTASPSGSIRSLATDQGSLETSPIVQWSHISIPEAQEQSTELAVSRPGSSSNQSDVLDSGRDDHVDTKSKTLSESTEASHVPSSEADGLGLSKALQSICDLRCALKSLSVSLDLSEALEVKSTASSNPEIDRSAGTKAENPWDDILARGEGLLHDRYTPMSRKPLPSRRIRDLDPGEIFCEIIRVRRESRINNLLLYQLTHGIEHSARCETEVARRTELRRDIRYEQKLLWRSLWQHLRFRQPQGLTLLEKLKDQNFLNQCDFVESMDERFPYLVGKRDRHESCTQQNSRLATVVNKWCIAGRIWYDHQYNPGGHEHNSEDYSLLTTPLENHSPEVSQATNSVPQSGGPQGVKRSRLELQKLCGVLQYLDIADHSATLANLDTYLKLSRDNSIGIKNDSDSSEESLHVTIGDAKAKADTMGLSQPDNLNYNSLLVNEGQLKELQIDTPKQTSADDPVSLKFFGQIVQNRVDKCTELYRAVHHHLRTTVSIDKRAELTRGLYDDMERISNFSERDRVPGFIRWCMNVMETLQDQKLLASDFSRYQFYRSLWLYFRKYFPLAFQCIEGDWTTHEFTDSSSQFSFSGLNRYKQSSKIDTGSDSFSCPDFA